MRSLLILAWMAGPLRLCQSGEPQDLTFKPKPGDTLVVQYDNDLDWDYKDVKSKGSLRTELTIRWTFGSAVNGRVQARGTYDRVLYRGTGVDKKGPWKSDA